MKILIVRYTDQPAINIVENISRYSKHDYKIINRDNLNISGHDVVFYYNVNDLFQPKVYKMLKESQHPICTGAQSWRLLFEEDWLKKIKALNVVGICSPTQNILDAVVEKVNVKVTAVAPFSADERFFKETNPVKIEGKLRVGYIGTFRPDKRYNEVVKPAFDVLKNEVELVIYGRASGKRLGHGEMYKGYNKMDCLVVGSKYESGPMPPLEAALCGRSTITTRCGMMEDVFDDTTSIFIDHDYKDLVEAIKKFIDTRELCITMGQRSKERIINEWCWENIIKYQDGFFEGVNYID